MAVSGVVPISFTYNGPDGTLLFTSANLALPTYATYSPDTQSCTYSKMLPTPGSNTEMLFTLTTTQTNLNATSRVIIVFPLQYTPWLSRDNAVFCFINSQSLECTVTRPRVLEIKYFKTAVAPGTAAAITVIGVTQVCFFF